MTRGSRLQERGAQTVTPFMCRNCQHTCRSGFSTCRRGSRLRPTCCCPTWSAHLSAQVDPSLIWSGLQVHHTALFCCATQTQAALTEIPRWKCCALPQIGALSMCVSKWDMAVPSGPSVELFDAQAMLLCLQAWSRPPPALCSFQMPPQHHSCLQHPSLGMPQRAQAWRQELESSSRPLRQHRGLCARPQGSAAPTSGRMTRRQGSWRPTRWGVV